MNLGVVSATLQCGLDDVGSPIGCLVHDRVRNKIKNKNNSASNTRYDNL